MNPSEKSPEIENLLEKFTGRTTSIKSDHCIKPPLGCGKPIKGFRNSISEKEFGISGMCQDCQDEFFGKD